MCVCIGSCGGAHTANKKYSISVLFLVASGLDATEVMNRCNRQISIISTPPDTYARAMIDSSSLVLDNGTKRLLDLTRQPGPFRTDDDVHNILAIVNAKAPKLLDGLTEANCLKIARELEIRCYEKDQVVFRQGDPPDCYYTVIRGTASIYALNNKNSGAEEQKHGRDVYGKFLVQLPPGSSFGELSFNANGKHSPRNAGVVSDGSHGQSRVLLRSDESAVASTLSRSSSGGCCSCCSSSSIAANGRGGGGLIEVEASNVAVLLCISEKLYMKELFPRHAAKDQTKEKLAFLRSSFLFEDWPADKLIKLAYSMKKKTFAEGTTIAREGDRIEFVHMIRKGRIRVVKRIKGKQRKRTHGGGGAYASGSSPDRTIDIAELGEGDMFGLVEAASKSKKMKREALAIKPTDVFTVPLGTFGQDINSRTLTLVNKIVNKRTQWETLRIDYSSNFPSMPHSLPGNWKSMSKYELKPASVLSVKEWRQQNEKSVLAYRSLREARALYRVATAKSKASSPSLYSDEKAALLKIVALCEEARRHAEDAFCCEKKRGRFLADVDALNVALKT